MRNRNSKNRYGDNRKRNDKDLYHKTMERFPNFVNYLVEDLLKVEEYFEAAVAFGSGVSLDAIRALANGKHTHVNRKMFQELISFYSRVFCGRCTNRFHDRRLFDEYLKDE